MSGKRQPRRGPKAPLARYANYFEVGHNPYEFLIDFGQFQPETAGIVLHTRIAIGPAHSKLLTDMLSSSVLKYESDNGPIADVTDKPNPLEAVLHSLPDFEQRAVEARRKSVAAIMAAEKHIKKKR